MICSQLQSLLHFPRNAILRFRDGAHFCEFSLSGKVPSLCEIPQGSVIGQQLFLALLKDLHGVLHILFLILADATNIKGINLPRVETYGDIFTEDAWEDRNDW